MTTRRAGRYTVALALVLLGAGLLADNLVGTYYTDLLLRFWPLVLIGIGLEFLLWSGRSDVRVGADWGGIWLLVLVGLLVGLYQGPGFFVRWNQHLDPNVLPARYEHRQTEVVPAAGLRELVIRTGSANLEVRPGAVGELRLDLTVIGAGLTPGDAERNAEARRIALTSVGQRAEVEIAIDPNAGPVQRSRLRVEVPPGVNVWLDTGSGGADVASLQGNLEIESGSGHVRVAQVDGKVQIDSGSGGIRLEQVKGDIDVEGGSGLVEIYQPGAAVRGEIGSGGLRLVTDQPVAGDYLLEAGSGQMVVSFPRTSSVQVSARTKSGSISGPDWLFVSHEGVATGMLGSGEHRILLEAGSGSIRVETP